MSGQCLVEIFRHLPGGQERSAAACVSNALLLSSIRILNFTIARVLKQNKKYASRLNIEMIFADEDSCDGYLTRCVEGKKATDLRTFWE